MFYLLLFSFFFDNVYSDIIYPKYEKEPNQISSDNLIAMSLWGMTSCMCIKKLLNYKNKLPIILNKKNSEFEKEYFDIEIKEKDNIKKDIKKLKKDLNEIKKILIEYEKNL